MRSSAGMLEVEIANNGKPIPEEILGKIFKKAVTGKSGGTGVGLLITRDLLAKNDISIEIKNMEAEGVKVITKLPLCGNERQGGENG
jgi:nitrogen-specific signal transduction histidine kinase